MLYLNSVNTFALASIIVSLAAIFAVISFRFLRLPTTIGTMVLSIFSAMILTFAGKRIPGIQPLAVNLFTQIDFHNTVLHAMLAFLLFAGAMHLDLDHLKRQRVAVLVLATLGTVFSTVVVAGLLWLILAACHLPGSFFTCLLFGALISPTDPIAVLEMLGRVGAPAPLKALLGGESLFNDGVGAVIFLALLGSAASGVTPSAGTFATLLLVESGGGILLGLLLGFAVYRILLLFDSYRIEVLLTLALAMGGYALADALHLSAPLEAVAAGLFLKGPGRNLAMSQLTRDHIDQFWGLLDDILNVVLFLLLGFALVIVPLSGKLFLAGLLTIPVVLFARGASVALLLFPLRRQIGRFGASWAVLTWGGLRGALSVALVLALTDRPETMPLLSITYTVVVFSVIFQGLTMVPLLRRLGFAKSAGI